MIARIVDLIKPLYRGFKQLPDRLRYGRYSPTFVRIGSAYGGWWVDLGMLDKDSRIVSAGVGEDITFDLELIQHVGCNVHAYDPTPNAVEFLRKTDMHPSFVFHPVAVAATDGYVELSPPTKQGWTSYILPTEGKRKLEFPSQSIKSIIGALGWDSIDLLKLDIEGCEYQVIDSVIQKNISVRQLCVEFHDGLGKHFGFSAKQSIKMLRQAGFLLVYKEYMNYTFIHEHAI